MKQYMLKGQAIEAMKQGKKVAHQYFDKGEWIAMVGDYIITEEGYQHRSDLFWQYRNTSRFDDGWFIIGEDNAASITITDEEIEEEAERILSKYCPATRTTETELAWTYDAIESAMVEIAKWMREKLSANQKPMQPIEIKDENWKGKSVLELADELEKMIYVRPYDLFKIESKAARLIWKIRTQEELSANQDLYEEIERLKKQVEELSANQITPKQRSFLDLNTPLGGY